MGLSEKFYVQNMASQPLYKSCKDMYSLDVYNEVCRYKSVTHPFECLMKASEEIIYSLNDLRQLLALFLKKVKKATVVRLYSHICDNIDINFAFPKLIHETVSTFLFIHSLCSVTVSGTKFIFINWTKNTL